MYVDPYATYVDFLYFRKQMLKMAKKTFTDKIGMNRKGRRDVDGEDPFHELSRCNSYDFDALGLKARYFKMYMCTYILSVSVQ